MEYWSARDLQKPLGYEKWDNFSKVIDMAAMLACDVAGLMQIYIYRKIFRIFTAHIFIKMLNFAHIVIYIAARNENFPQSNDF